MDNFVTIRTFNQSTDLVVLRGRLEADGIECRVLDSQVALTIPFMSNAIGGVKLQVRKDDVPEAIEILREGGYINENDLQPDNLNEVANATSRLPFLKDLSLERRLFILVIMAALVLIGLFYLVILPLIS